MANQSIIDDLNRVKKGVLQRGPRWEYLVKALKDADTAARDKLEVVSKQLGGSYGKNLTWGLALATAASAAYFDTRINGIPTGAFIGKLGGPLMHGFLWFQAIFNVRHGRGQTTYDLYHSNFPVGGSIDSFQDITSPTHEAQQLARELERLIKAVGAEKDDVSKPDADKAISAMLLAPLLYPPTSVPDAKAIELQIEWHAWQVRMPDIAENIYADSLAAKVYENPPKTNLDPLFNRLGELVMGAYQARVPLTGAPAMDNLETLRKGLERRTITGANFLDTRSSIDLSVPVSFPAKVKSYLSAQGFDEQQKVYLAVQRMTFAEAGL